MAGQDEDVSFFWLLTSQRDAAVAAKSRRRQGLQDSGGVHLEPPSALGSAAWHDAGALHDEEPDGMAPDTPATAVLLGLARGGAANVPAFLQRHAFAEHLPSSEALRAAAGEALLAALQHPSTNSDAANELPAAAQDLSSLQAAVAAAVAARGLPSIVGSLLKLGADPSQVHDSGATALVAALLGGHLQAAELLLDAGAQPDAPAWATAAAEAAAAAAAAAPAAGKAGPASNGGPGKRKRREGSPSSGAGNGEGDGEDGHPTAVAQPSPLVLAVVAGSKQLAECLVAARADVNRQCTVQLAGVPAPVALTPLVAAVQTGSADMVAALLAAGADLHQKCVLPGTSGVDWTSALSTAVLGGSDALVQQLVDAGACAPRKSGGSIGQDHPALRAVVLAAQRGRLAAVELMYPMLAAALQGGSAAMLGVLRRRTILHPLAAAAERGQLAVVDRLLQLGAPPNHDRNVWAGVVQCTPLMLAAANGHLSVMDRLLAAGASPLTANAREEMAATLALQRGQLAALRRLLDHSGEVVAAGTAGGMAAAEVGGDPGGVGQLAGQQAQQAAAVLEAAQGAPCLQLDNASRAWQTGWASGALHRSKPASLAALGQERQRYRMLLLALLGAHAGSAQAAAHVRQLVAPSCLAHAAAGSEALLDALLAAGVSIASCVDPTDGTFPLMAAAHHGWPAMLRLLRRGAHPNQATSSGTTTLMLLAARPSMLETAKQLLSWHAEQVEQQRLAPGSAGGIADAGGAAAVGAGATAAGEEAAGAAAASEEAGAGAQQAQQAQQGAAQVPALDLQQKDGDGRDAVGAALACKNRRFAEELLAHMVATSAPAQRRVEAGAAATGVAAKAYDLLAELEAKCVGDVNILREGKHVLLAQLETATHKQLRQTLALPGLDLGVRDPATGRTPLMLLAARQQPLLVADLLATGRADVEARDPSGATAALLAARACNPTVLRLLLDAGADVDCADNAGDTLLMALARLGQHKLLSELLHARHAASINCQDARGWTALHHAAAGGQFNACRVLRSHGADVGLCTAEGARTAADLAQEGGHSLCLPLLKPPVDGTA